MALIKTLNGYEICDQKARDAAAMADGKAVAAQNTANGKANAVHSHSYLPLSGGTVTGITEFNNGISMRGNASVITGDGTWLFFNNIATSQLCTQRSSYYPVYGAKILYANNGGATGTFTLNESAGNFVYLEFFFRTNDGECNSAKIWQPNGKLINLSSSRITAGSGSGWDKSKQMRISGVSVWPEGYFGEAGIGTDNTGGSCWVGSILIYCVVGYR